jgi:excinuclease UvrABC nuclease subunit
MSDTVKWLSYEFTVYTPNTTWNDVAGVYIFCGVNAQNQWVALYVGQADSFRNRIPSHEQWSPTVRLGATHVHARVVPQAATRDAIERELIQACKPRLNTQLK